VYLTEQELAELVSSIDARLSEYVDKRPLDDLAARPPGSVPVEFTLMVVPKAPTSTGN
jgi:hypothetical protein